MKKRLLAMLLTVCMVFTMLPMTAFAAWIDDVPLAALPEGDEVHGHTHEVSERPSGATDAAHLAEVTQTETVSGETPVLTNLARLPYVTAEASGNETNSFPPEKAIDGDRNSRWSGPNNTDPAWIILDLHQLCSVSQINLYWQRDNVIAYKLEVSADKQNWTEVHSTSERITSTNESFSFDTPYENVRYVRVYSDNHDDKGAGGYSNISLWEVEVYGQVHSETVMAQLGTSNAFNGGQVPLSNALYTITSKGDTAVLYTVSARVPVAGTTVYLNNGTGTGATANRTADLAANTGISFEVDGEWFRIKTGVVSGANTTRLYFVDSALDNSVERRFDRMSSYQSEYASGYRFALFREATAADQTTGQVIPGYTRLTSVEQITSGSQYLIAHQSPDGTWYVLYPSGEAAGYEHVAKVVPMSFAEDIHDEGLNIAATYADGDIAGVTATAPSQQGADTATSGDGPAGHAVDASDDTYWHTKWGSSGNKGHEGAISNRARYGENYIELTLPEVTNIAAVRHLPRKGMANGRINNYEVRVSVDGIHWTTVKRGNFANNNNNWQIANFGRGVPAKYVRLYATGSYGNSLNVDIAVSSLRVVAAPATHTITYMNNGEVLSTLTGYEGVAAGSDRILSSPNDKPGYTFLGWYDENGECFTANTVVTRNMTVHPEWRLESLYNAYAAGSSVINKETYTMHANSAHGNHSTEGSVNYAKDDRLDTWWHTEYTDHTAESRQIWVELPEAQLVSAFRYKPREDKTNAANDDGNGYVTEYRIQVSMTGNTNDWKTVAEGAWNTYDESKSSGRPNGEWQTAEFPSTMAKFIKLVGVTTKGNNLTNQYMHAAEIRAIGAQVLGVDSLEAPDGWTLADNNRSADPETLYTEGADQLVWYATNRGTQNGKSMVSEALTLTFDSVKLVERFRVKVGNGDNWQNYAVQASLDGSTWETLGEYNETGTENEHDVILDTPVYARYLRLVNCREQSGWAKFQKFIAWGQNEVELPTYEVRFGDHIENVVQNSAVSTHLPTDPAAPEGQRFLGWYTADGELIHESTIVKGNLAAEAYFVPTGELLAADGTDGNIEPAAVTAPSVQDGYAPENVKNNTSYWQSEWTNDHVVFDWAANKRDREHDYAFEGNNYIQLNLGSAQRIDAVRYQPQKDQFGGRIVKYSIRVSSNGTNFVTVATGTWETRGEAGTAWKAVSFKPVEAQYVRLYAHTADNGGTEPFQWKDANMNVAGLWAVAAPVTVTFKNGTKTVDTATVRPGSTVTLPEANTLTKPSEFHTFDKWVVINGETETEFTAATAVTGDLTVTAKWTLDTSSAVAKIGETYYSTLQAALSAAESGDEIVLLADVTAPNENGFTINKSVTINGGDAKHTVTAFADLGSSRAFNIVESNGIDVTIKNLSIDAQQANRGISAYQARDLSLNLENVDIVCDHYAVNIASLCDGAAVNVSRSNITGYCAIQSWSPADITVTDSTLVGYNKWTKESDSDFAALVFTGGFTENDSLASGSTLTVTNSTVKTIATSTAVEEIMSFQGKGMENVTATFTRCTFESYTDADCTKSTTPLFLLSGIIGENNVLKCDQALREENFLPDQDDKKIAHSEADGLHSYTLADKSYVAQIGDATYETLQEAFAAAADMDGDVVITLLADVSEDATLEAADKTVTLDATSHTVNATMMVNAGTLVVEGGTFDTCNRPENDRGTNDHCLIAWNEGAKIIVNDGTFVAGCTAAYAKNGEIVINGGEFSVDPDDPEDGTTYLLNLWDKSATASITVNGGVFHDYDPADSASENPKACFVAGNKIAVKGENGVYTIGDAKATLIDLATGAERGYATAQAAVNASKPGDTVKLLAAPEGGTIEVPNEKAVQIDKNGHTANIDCQARALGGNGSAFAIYGGLEAVVEAEPLVRAEKKPQSTTTYIYLRKSVQLKDDIYLPSRNATTMGIYTEAKLTIDLNGHNITQQSSQEAGAPGKDANAAVVACADTTIQGNGTITGAAIGLTTYKGGKITLRDATVTTKGSFYGNTWWGSVVHLMGGEFNMESGKLVLPTAENAKYDGAFWVPGNAFEAAKVTIRGGEIETGTASLVANENLAGRPAPTYAITGGTFDMDLTGAKDAAGNKYLGDAFWSLAKDNETGKFVVQEKKVAEVNEIKYATLQEAINVAGGSNATVTLLASISESVVVPAGTQITLDLNEKTLTNEAGQHTITVAKEGVLHLINGTVDNVSHGKAALVNLGTADLDGGVTLERSEEKGTSATENGGNSYYTVNNQGKLTIRNATLKNNGVFSSLIENGYYDSTGKTEADAATLTIIGGTFSGGKYTVKNDDWGVLEISGGTFTNAAQATILNWNEATISGGTFNGTAANAAVVNGKLNNPADKGQLTIRGGEFTAAEGKNVLIPASKNAEDLNGVAISGGTFSSDVNKYCVEGYCWSEKNENKVAQHIWPEDWTVERDATCKDTGLKSKTCSRCGAKQEEVIPVDENAHNLEYVERVEPTVDATGTEAHWICVNENAEGETCGKRFKDEDGTEETTLEALIIRLTAQDVINANLKNNKFVGVLASQPSGDVAPTFITATVDGGYNGTLTIPYKTVNTGALTLGVGLKGVQSLGMGADETRSHVLETKLGNKQLDLSSKEYKKFLQLTAWQGFQVNTTVVNPGTNGVKDTKAVTHTFAVDNAADKVTLQANAANVEAARAAWKAIFQNTTAPVGANDSKIVVKAGSYFQAGTKKVVLQQSGDLVVDNFQNLNMAALRKMFQVTEVSESSKATLFLKKGTTLAVGTSSVTLTKDVTISSDNLEEGDVAQMVQYVQALASDTLSAESQKFIVTMLLGNIVGLPSLIEGASDQVKVPMNLTVEFACEHEWGEWTEDTAATCMMMGVNVRECSICGEKDIDNEVAINPNNHVMPLAKVEYKAPTVEETGNEEHYICACGVKFWDADATRKVEKDEDVIIGKLDAVAQIEGTELKFATLQEAVNAAENGQTVKLLATTEGSGVKLMAADKKSVIIDLGGYTYTVVKNPVGSVGYETQGFHFEKGNTVTLKNGTVKAADNVDAQVLIQNYCDLTLADLSLVGGTATNYGLSCNAGTTKLTNVNISGAATNFTALDVMHWHGRYDAPTMTIANDDDHRIEGKVAVYCHGNTADTCDTPATLEITGGTYSADVNEWCAEGYVAKQTEGKQEWTVTRDWVAKVTTKLDGTEKLYPTLKEALAAAKDEGDIVQLLRNTQTSEPLTVNPGVTLNGAGHTLTKNNTKRGVVLNATDATVENLVITVNGNGRAIDTLGSLTVDRCIFNMESGSQAITVDQDGKSRDVVVQNCIFNTKHSMPIRANTKFINNTLNGADITIWGNVDDAFVTGNTFNDATLVIMEPIENEKVTIKNNKLLGTSSVQLEEDNYTEPVELDENYWPEYETADKSTWVDGTNRDVVIVTWYGTEAMDELVAGPDAVAQVGKTFFGSVQKAIEAAGAEGVVKLLKSTTESVTVAADKNITLDLNGQKLTNAAGKDTIVNNGTLTVVGGTVDNVSHGKAALVNNGTATLDGDVVMDRSKETGVDADTSGGNSYYTVDNKGTMTINAATVQQNGKYSSLIRNLGVKDGGKGVLTINAGAKLSGGLNNVKNDDYGTLKIYGGTFSGASQDAVKNWNVATINGGEFNGRVWNGVWAKDNVMTGVGQMSIHGGTFNGEVVNSMTPYPGASLDIDGGTFTQDVNLYCKQGYCWSPANANKVEAHQAHLVHHAAVKATCTEDGNIEYWSCDRCNKNFSNAAGTTVITGTVVINKTGHAMTKTEANPATCTQPGNKEYWTCGNCGLKFSDEAGTTVITDDDIVIGKLGHDMTHHDADPATCTEDGTVEYWSCSRCEKNFSDEMGTTVIDDIVDHATGHQMTDVPVDPATYEHAGTKAHKKCDRCGKLFDLETGKEVTKDELKIAKLELADVTAYHGGTVTGTKTTNVIVTFDASHTLIFTADGNDQGRLPNKWWAGIRVANAENASTDAKYQKVAQWRTDEGQENAAWTDFQPVQTDGQYWGMATPALMNEFKGEDGKLMFRYAFDWDNNGEADQYVTIEIKDTVNYADEGKIAEVGSIAYPTVQEAIEAAEAKDTVKLLKSTTENVTVPAGKDIVLDLNGKTLNGNFSTSHVLTNNGTLVIEDSSEAKTGKITRDESSVTETTKEAHKDHGYIILNAGTLTLNGGTIEGKCTREGNPPSTICNGPEKGNIVGELTINEGATVYAERGIAVKNDENGTLVMTGGTVSNNTDAHGNNFNAIQNWKDATITGGQINGDVGTWTYGSTNATTNMSGTVHVKGEVIQRKHKNAQNDPKTVISGGFYSAAVNPAFCENNAEATGCCWAKENETDEYGQVKQHTVSSAHNDTHHWDICSRCGSHFNEKPHEWTETKVIKGPTCKETGIQEFKCTCGETKTETMAKIPHTVEIIPGKAATCTETGLTEGKHCSVCKEIIKAQETIPAKGHTAVIDAAKAPTCTETGLTEGTHCSVCGEVITAQTVIEALGHDMQEVKDSAKAPTCTEPGKEADQACAREGCDHIVPGAAIEKLGHNTEGSVAHKDATCTEDGVVGGTYCTRCNEGKEAAEKVITKLGHDNKGYVAHRDATCAAEGVVGGHFCERCGEGRDDAMATIPTLKHKTSLVSAGQAATCTEPGAIAYWRCVNKGCDKLFSDAEGTHEITEDDIAIPALEHDLTHHDAVPATCSEEGRSEYWSCERCNKVFSDAAGTTETTLEALKTDKLPHTEVIDEAEPATCTTPGKTAGKHCSVCGEVIEAQETIPATGHNFAHHVAVPATCTKPGNIEYWSCDRCDKLFSDVTGNTETSLDEVTIPATGHNFAHHVAVPATCTADGNIAYWTCENCDKVFSEDAEGNKVETTVEALKITAKGHTFANADIAATCTAPGRTGRMRCSVCDVIISEGVPTAPLGHDWDEGEVTTPATCSTTGEKTFTCTRDNCDATKTETVPTIAHTWDEGVVTTPATCTERGVKVQGCTHCDATNTVIIPALGHDYEAEFTVDKAATCTEAGSKSKHCSRCDAKTEETVIEATGHTEVIDAAVEATCTTPGKTAGKHCSVCNEVLEAQEIVPVKPHTLTHTEAKAATCTEKGNVEYWTCDVCEKVFVADDEGNQVELAEGKTVELDALGHDLTKWAFDENGHWHVCSRCEDAEAKDEAVAHTWDNGTLSGNIRTFTCTAGCGATRTQTVSTGGGSYTPPTPPTPPEEDLNEPDVPLAKPFLFTDVTENDWFYEAVKYVYEKDIMVGINDEGTLFGPGLDTTRATVATIIHRMENKPAAEAAGFSDVLADMWYTDAVNWTDKSGVMIGFGDGSFGPAINISREQLVTVLYRYAKLLDRDVSATGDLTAFDDAETVSSWAAEAMTWAVGCKLITGRNGSNLAPQETTTRGELATILQRFLEAETEAK